MEPSEKNQPETQPKTGNAIIASLRIPLIQYLLMFLAVLCVFVPTFWYTYVWDDWAMIARNESLREWKNIPEFFTDANTFSHDPKDEGRNEWRPLRNVYFLITYKIHGLHPAGWHFHHVLLHCLVAAMLLAFFHRLYRYTLSWPQQKNLSPAIQVGAWISVFAWAVHPANTEVTAWLKSGDDILASIMTLGAMLLLFPTHKPLTYSRAIWAGIIFAFAFLAKESIAPIPMIYIALVVILSPERRRALSHKPHWLAAFLLFAGLGIYMVLRTIMLGQLAQVPYLAGNLSLMMATMTTAVVRYLQLTFWPFWPTVQIGDYIGWPLSRSWFEPRVISSFCIILITTIIVGVISRRSRLFLAGWVFAVFAFLPVANIVPMMQVMAERFMYFPLMGIALAMSAACAWLLSRDMRWIWLPTAACAALLVTTHTRLPAWISEQNFQKSASEAAPGSWRPTYNYALSLYEEGRTTPALAVMLSIMDKHPVEDGAIFIAHILQKNGQITSASRYLEKIQAAYPDGYQAYKMAGDIAYAQDKTSEALAMYEKALTKDPDNPLLLYSVGLSASDMGETTRALETATKAVELEPQWSSPTLLLRSLSTSRETTEPKPISKNPAETPGPTNNPAVSAHLEVGPQCEIAYETCQFEVRMRK